jgi:hypothetical protein
LDAHTNTRGAEDPRSRRPHTAHHAERANQSAEANEEEREQAGPAPDQREEWNAQAHGSARTRTGMNVARVVVLAIEPMNDCGVVVR